jgi:type I restriction enzyme S subunit
MTVSRGVMTPRWHRYSKYQDSCMDFLGEIPIHWELRRIKEIASVQLSNVDKKSVEGQMSVRLCNYLDVYNNERIIADMEFMAATATPQQAHRLSLKRGDVLITKDSEAWNDIAVPAVVVEDLSMVLCGYHLALIRPDKEVCDGKYLARAFVAIGPRDQFHVAANGITRFGLGEDAIRTGLFAIPPVHEQYAISTFLDRETAKIDGLVAKKEKLIELLQEKRAAIITQAVTKGLDPTVPMKDSGVEWLGKIPAHWEIKRLKYLTTINDETLREDTDPDLEILYVDIANVDSTKGITDKEKIVFEKAPSRARRIVKDGDVIVSTVRTYLRAIAPIKNAENNLIVSTGFAVIRPRKILTAFASYLFCSNYFVDQVVSNSFGVSYPAINESKLACFNIAYSTEQEQNTIADFLDRETAKIDALVEKIQKGIALLKEYRSALISAAVTGKIDVRGEI